MTPTDQDAPATPIRLLIADADRRVRNSLSCLIALADDIDIVRTVGDTDSVVATLMTGPVDVILLDPQLPGIDAGFALLELVRMRWPSISVVAMSGSYDLASACLAEGACAFLAKDRPPDALVETIRRAAHHDLPAGVALGAMGATLEAAAGPA